MLKDYLSDQIETGLYSVDYQCFDSSEEERGLVFRDGCEAQIQESCLYAVFFREMKFDPEGIFFVKVSIFVKHFWKKEFTETNDENFLKLDAAQVAKEMLSDQEFYSQYQYNRISLLIGQITSTFGNAVITPPMMTVEIEDEVNIEHK